MENSENVAPVEVLEQACVSTGAVFSQVGADQLDRTTPCAQWRVRELIDHIIGAVGFFGDLAEWGTSPAGRDWPAWSAAGASAVFDEEARRMVAAFSSPGAMTRIMGLPTGPSSGAEVIEVATGEIFVHGWDLARAVGQPLPPDPGVAAALLASGWPARCDQVRSGDPAPIAPARPVAATAPPLDRLLAHLGRDPNWLSD
ncbi:MAG: TIGR03086 family protein [Actinobacteria bacterium]|nr:TIGR03086 family protein [Actinomycetota bacterium]